MQGPEGQKGLFLILTVSNSDAVAGNTSVEVTVCKGKKDLLILFQMLYNTDVNIT